MPHAVLRSLLISWAVLAVAFALTSWILSGLTVSGGVWGYIWVSALFGIVNAIIGTILRLLTFPLIILTLGLFAIIVNALLLELTDVAEPQPDDRLVLLDGHLGGDHPLDLHRGA